VEKWLVERGEDPTHAEAIMELRRRFWGFRGEEMMVDQDDFNRFLGGQGSINERNRIVKELDDERLQKAARYCPEAKEEIDHRRAARIKRWVVLGVVAPLVVSAVAILVQYCGLVRSG
jgi:t-SNARE complex subunit (syntaxin)